MKFHFLVTISNNVNHLFGVRFICSFFGNLSDDYQITLLHISRGVKHQASQDLGRMWDGPESDAKVRISPSTKNAISKSRELLMTQKMAGEKVQIKTLPEHYGKTLDIVKEGEFGQYDAIVLGRRAAYALQWMFENPADETAKNIIRSLCSVPVWICPELDPGRTNVLLCLDGSENSIRAADHVGYIVASKPHQAITLFHAESPENSSSPDLFSRAESILHEHQIGSERINRKAERGRNIPGSILTEVNRGNYAVVALGLHGAQEHAMKQQYKAGSCITKLVSNMEKAVIWCCP